MILTAKDLQKAWHRLTFRSLSQGKILCYTSSMRKNLKKKMKKKQAWFNNTKFILCEHYSQRSHG